MGRWPGGALARWGAGQVGAHLAEAELASPGPSHLRTTPNSAMWWLKGAIPTTSQISRHDPGRRRGALEFPRSEEHTSELQSRGHLVCRLLLEKKKTKELHTKKKPYD